MKKQLFKTNCSVALQALQYLCPNIEIVNELDLPCHWMREFFLANLCLDLQHNQEGLSRLQNISQHFPNSPFVISHAAVAHYNLRNFEESQDLFEDVLKRDPHRLEVRLSCRGGERHLPLSTARRISM